MKAIDATPSGFTLIEAVIVIAITGIVAAIVAAFIKTPVQGYLDSARRAELSDIGDTALRRISRDLHLAVPNTVRVTTVGSTSYLEFLQSKTGGFYRSACSVDPCPVTENILDFTAADAGFDVLGGFSPLPSPQPALGDRVVIFNTGDGNLDAYTGGNTAAINSATATSVTLSAAFQFPAQSPSNHFQVIETPVTYVCAPGGTAAEGTGTLTRIWGYSITALQATPPVGGTSAQLADKVSACAITQPWNLPQPGFALVTMNLQLRSSSEDVTLYHEAHINNVP